jgi:hypothetical protein
MLSIRKKKNRGSGIRPYVTSPIVSLQPNRIPRDKTCILASQFPQVVLADGSSVLSLYRTEKRDFYCKKNT